MLTFTRIIWIFFSDEPHPQNDLYKAYGHVNTIVFFIGYPRSRHSLLGSLLDAHPHMIVSDETMAFGRWRSGYQNKWKNSAIYTYYDTMFRASQRSVSQGRRSQVFEGNVMNKTSAYKYYVPNQWQGNYDQYIQVGRRIWSIQLVAKIKETQWLSGPQAWYVCTL